LAASKTKAEKLAEKERLRIRQAYLKETVRLGEQLQADLTSLQKEREDYDKEFKATRALLLTSHASLTAEGIQDRMNLMARMTNWKNRLEDKQKALEASLAVLKARKS
jgi:hypothetical protein